jgi:hypothetical protein
VLVSLPCSSQQTHPRRGGGDSDRRFGATQGAVPPRVVYGLEVQFGSVADFDPLLGSPPEVRREGVRSAV